MTAAPVVLVTGAARRIGRQIAQTLAARGWRLALHCHTSLDDAQALQAQLQSQGCEAAVFQADLGDEAACLGLGAAVLAQFGRWDAVVNNASLFEHDTVFSASAASLDRHWRANTLPALLLSRQLHAHCQGAQRQGCVVNISDQKLWNPNPDHLSYTLSKAALEAATTLLAQGLAPWVRVCGVAPGVSLPSGPMTAAQFQAAHQLTPLGRSSTPEDIARAVAFMLESPAITGSTLLVDGGQHLAAQPRDVLFLTPDPQPTS
ncbi:SDR family oxidoreductase [Roseateles sp. BYS180W]|uniref:SDR family oxidoreductase n=1 Tax=Roseateles rivi TaxID=3299028 RepID=A0ABW7FR90_9BURK